jgi:hypothetical protein
MSSAFLYMGFGLHLVVYSSGGIVVGYDVDVCVWMSELGCLCLGVCACMSDGMMLWYCAVGLRIGGAFMYELHEEGGHVSVNLRGSDAMVVGNREPSLNLSWANL